VFIDRFVGMNACRSSFLTCLLSGCTAAPSQRLLEVSRTASVVFTTAGSLLDVLGKNATLVLRLHDEEDEEDHLPEDGG
jgi:hypothetical protein